MIKNSYSDQVAATDPCPCGKPEEYGKCCGAFSSKETKAAGHIQVTRAVPKYFLITGPGLIGVPDDDGRIPVYQSRAQALGVAERKNGGKAAAMVIGMGEEKYKMFSADFPNHYIVPASVA